jgi:type I restriction enzyme S subunit
MGIIKTKFSETAKYQFLRIDYRFHSGKENIFAKNNIFKIGQFFKTGRGVVMNKEYISENEGDYPVYSSQTAEDGILGYIDTYMFDGEYLTWTTDGAKAGTVFYRNGKFNCTNVCGTAKLKADFEHLFELKFLAFYLNTVTKYYVSVASGNPKLMNNVFEDIRIPNIAISVQKDILSRITPLEIEISKLKSSKFQPLNIINQVFGEVFEFDESYYKEFGKGMTAGTQRSNLKETSIYKVTFSLITKSNIVRVSSRFHNPKMQFFYERLHSKPTLKVKDILLEKTHRGASPQYDAEGDIPVIKTAHLKNDFIEISEDEFVNEDFYKKIIRSQVFENEVLIASTGKVSLGKVDIVASDQNFVVDGHITILRVNQSLYNPLFLTYFLRSILGAFQIERDFTGATNQIELYTSEIESFDIPNFKLEVQAKIVEKIKTQLNAQKEIDKQIEEKQKEINRIIEESIKQYSE